MKCSFEKLSVQVCAPEISLWQQVRTWTREGKSQQDTSDKALHWSRQRVVIADSSLKLLNQDLHLQPTHFVSVCFSAVLSLSLGTGGQGLVFLGKVTR